MMPVDRRYAKPLATSKATCASCQQKHMQDGGSTSFLKRNIHVQKSYLLAPSSNHHLCMMLT